jgi:hypothetical protein
MVPDPHSSRDLGLMRVIPQAAYKDGEAEAIPCRGKHTKNAGDEDDQRQREPQGRG